MKLFATSAYPTHACLDTLRHLAVADIHGNHSLVDDAVNADAIIFVENTHFDDLQFKRVQRHPLALAYPNRVFMYNEMDQAWPVLPGLYCSLSSKLTDPAKHTAFPYLSSLNPDIRNIYDSREERKLLYSFVGSRSHPIRRQIFSLDKNNARIIDTSDFCAWRSDESLARSYQSLYAQTMAASKFVLCPRGIGPSSLRLYEAMEAGRVPVIISDHWSAPPQINWDFAVRIPEAEIASIPELLEQLEPQWRSRSLAARQAWQKMFSPESLFNSVGDAIDELSRSITVQPVPLLARMHKYKVLAQYRLRQMVRSVPMITEKPATNIARSAVSQHLPLTSYKNL